MGGIGGAFRADLKQCIFRWFRVVCLSGGAGRDMAGVKFGVFILWIFLKKYVDNQGENFPSSCKVLAFEYHKPNGNKILETQRIGYFRSFLFLILPSNTLHKDFFSNEGTLVFVSFSFFPLLLPDF